MTPREFILKWRSHALTERGSAQEHFIDLCRLLEHPTPAEADPAGEFFCFEKGASKTSGGDGFADVWKKGFFAWEYKKRRRDLEAAMKQLVDYSAALDNPPVHVVCDTIKFRIETRWTNTITRKEEFDLEQLMDDRRLAQLRAVFHDPEALRPKETRASLTKEAADKFQKISDRLQNRYPDRKEAVAHFVNQLVFCFFADSVGLLPGGVWKKLLLRAVEKPRNANGNLAELFARMERGGEYALEDIRWFNGKLFDGRPPLELNHDDFHLLLAAASVKWDLIDPTIFGTLFERFLDPDKRAQIGAHYTDPDKIMLIVEPVVLRPLRAEWAAARAGIDAALAKPGAAALAKATAIRDAFLERLRTLSILDPACGSGNFLYLALQHVKDLELKAIRECEPLGLDRVRPEVGPRILKGIEINPFAAELARAVIWIGDIQWEIRNNLARTTDPVLMDLDQIECRDALVDRREGGASFETPPAAAPQDEGRGGFGITNGPHAERGASFETPPAAAPQDEGRGGAGITNAPHAEEARSAVSKHAQPSEAAWPEAEFIVGNPPFLGGKKLRRDLGDDTVEALFRVYDGRVPAEADLVTYWFEKARGAIAAGRAKRAGFVATNSVRGGKNRLVLERAFADAPVFEAWSDEPWVLDGAAVRVSMVSFGEARADEGLRLDGEDVERINSDLSGARVDLNRNQKLTQNAGVCFQGIVKVGAFDISGQEARALLAAPLNPNGRPNSDIVRMWSNGSDIVQIPSDTWIIDFAELDEESASLYEYPFQIIVERVRELRKSNRDRQRRENWWRLGRSGFDVKNAIQLCSRSILTPRVAKHRLFVWRSQFLTPDSAVIAIARDDDTTFGILHSRFHEAWSLRLGTWLGVGNDPRYTPTTTFETFPFPEGLTPDIPASAYADDPRAVRIAEAAKKLDELRRNWLHPADLGTWEPEITPTAAPGEEPRKYPDRFIPRNVEAAVKLKERTLTNLYNQRPQWLASAHDTLDRAVAAAYGWPEDIAVDDALSRLLALNLERAAQGR
jgi:hypothetical protein